MEPKILLVVENEVFLESLAKIITTDIVCEVFSTTDFRQAIEIFRKNQPIALVLCDEEISQGDTLQLTSALRQLDPHQKIAVLTGEAHRLRKNLNLNGLRVDQVFAKPYDVNDFLEKVADLAQAKAKAR